MKPIKDFVIIKPELRDKCNGLIIDHTFDPSTHVPTIGTVVHLPHRLSVDNWETTMEIQVGDTVFIDKFVSLMAFGNEYNNQTISDGNRIITIDEFPHLYIRYQDLYMAIRNEQKIMLNGYALLTAIDWKPKSSLSIFNYVDKHYKIFKVEKTGSDVIYTNPAYYDAEISEGSYCVVDTARGKNSRLQNHVFPLEQSLYRTLDKEYYVSQKCFISATVNAEIAEENIALL